MITISTLPVWLISAAAVIYIVEHVSMAVHHITIRKASSRLRAIYDYMELEKQKLNVHFDLWWSGKPSNIVKTEILKTIPAVIVEQLPPEILSSIIHANLSAAREAAQQVTLYSRTIDRAQRDYEKLAKNKMIREEVEELTKHINTRYDNAVAMVTTYGLDPEKIIEAFA